MLSVKPPTVHPTICPTASNTSTTRLAKKERFWGKALFSKNRCRNSSTKNEIPIYIAGESTLSEVPKQLKNVSLSVVAATTAAAPAPDPSRKELAPISFNVKNKVWTTSKNEENTVVTNDIVENEVHWILDENDPTIATDVTAVGDTYDQVEKITVKEVAVERKRKRGVQSRMANAVKFLKTSEKTSIPTVPDTNQFNVISDVSNDDDSSNVTSVPTHNNDVDTWNNTKDVEENWEELWQSDNIYPDMPHYMMGFPNPPGENRCWLNATLHTLFILPLIDYLDRVNTNECSRLTKTLIAIKHFWEKGITKKDVTYQIVKKLKEELTVLDETYPSQKQQDVSEFLMIFLNYIKTECEQLSIVTKTKQTQKQIENVPENGQDQIVSVSRVQTTPKKRIPLAAISPLKQINNINETIERNVEILNLKNLDLESSDVSTTCNPIDKFFLLQMMEHYICKGCSEHRQRNIDNLMLYVDIPNKETETIDLTEAIAKSMEPEERILTCAKCKHPNHNVSTSFRDTPLVLIVQINRYGMTNEGFVEKINTAVNIPEELTLQINDNDTIDRFLPVGIIAHVGSAMDCGHYTSYTMHDDQWFHYNDMDVVPMSKEEALTAAQTTAYLVFFANVKLYSNKNNDTFDTEKNSLR